MSSLVNTKVHSASRGTVDGLRVQDAVIVKIKNRFQCRSIDISAAFVRLLEAMHVWLLTPQDCTALFARNVQAAEVI